MASDNSRKSTALKLDDKGPPPTSTEERKLLLYVDDEEANRQVLKLRLRSRFDIVLAANDREAVDALRTHGKRFHAFLLDIQLQGSQLDGIQIAKLIRGKLSSQELPPYAQGITPFAAPIVFVTAYGTRYTEQELKATSAELVVQKPVDFVPLCTALTRFYLNQVGRPQPA